ncbi:MAG: Gfo/Idh/MocA family oxidoreductase [Clostridiales bacterium]|nr:Gfo/Idh/MocA family oxidoreductase [Clostridiales bacterium]
MNKLLIGVLGVSGHFLKRIVLPLSHSKHVKITAIASRNIEKAKSTASRYFIEKYYGSYEELLDDPNIDAIFIPLPNHMHLEWIKKCINAKKHVLCEKPLTMNYEEIIELRSFMKGKEHQLMEAFMYRFHPKWIEAKKLIDNHYIGDIISIHTIFSYNNHDASNIRNIKEYGGGALMDIGCYAINTARFIIGKSPIRVSSLITTHKVFKTDIITSAILDFGDSRALFTVSTTSFPKQEVKVFGTEGTLTITIPFNDISEIEGKLLFENNESKETIKFPKANHYLIMFDEFAKAIKQNTKMPISLEDSAINMKVIDAIITSAEKNSWINID